MSGDVEGGLSDPLGTEAVRDDPDAVATGPGKDPATTFDAHLA